VERFKLNLSGRGTPVPEGRYPVEVVEVERRVAAHGGEYLNWALRIEDGEHAGKRLWMVTSLREDLLDLLATVLRAVNVSVDDGDLSIETDEDGVLVRPDIAGRRAVALVVHDEWQGETRTKVRRLVSIA